MQLTITVILVNIFAAIRNNLKYICVILCIVNVYSLEFTINCEEYTFCIQLHARCSNEPLVIIIVILPYIIAGIFCHLLSLVKFYPQVLSRVLMITQWKWRPFPHWRK